MESHITELNVACRKYELNDPGFAGYPPAEWIRLMGPDPQTMDGETLCLNQ